jgi:hypothetical protein
MSIYIALRYFVCPIFTSLSNSLATHHRNIINQKYGAYFNTYQSFRLLISCLFPHPRYYIYFIIPHYSKLSYFTNACCLKSYIRPLQWRRLFFLDHQDFFISNWNKNIAFHSSPKDLFRPMFRSNLNSDCGMGLCFSLYILCSLHNNFKLSLVI